MPGRYALLDSDEGRLPDGIQRVGYDADTEVYTFQSEDGSYWEGAPGALYGELRRTGTSGPVNRNLSAAQAQISAFQSEDWRYMAPFFLIVVVILLLVWHWFGPTFRAQCSEGLRPYSIQSGDTCWKIAESRGTTVDDLTKINKGLDCDSLLPGTQLCLP